MKRVTIYVLSLNYGGAEKAIANIANILADFSIVTIKSVYKLSETPFYYIDPRVKVVYLTDAKPNREEFKRALRGFKLITVIKEGLKAIKILKLKKQVMIENIKNDNSDIIITTRKEHNHYLGQYGRPGIIKIGQEHNDFKLKRDIDQVIEGAKNLDYFLPASKFLATKYTERLVNYPVKVRYIPHGIEKNTKPINAKEKRIIAVGRLEPIKAFDTLLHVFKIIHNGDSNCELVIAGDGSQRSYLLKLAKQLGIENKVIFKGFLSEEELQNEYQKARLLLSTSLSESFGLVVVEAANFGVPTLAFSSANGFKELIINGENGYLINDRNIDELAKKAIELLNNEEEWARLSQAAKESISKYYNSNIKTMWEDLINKGDINER